MAFTWEVEALRKLIEGIVEEVEIKQAGDELAQEAIDAYSKRPEANQLWDVYKEKWVPKTEKRKSDEKIAREQFELGPDDPLPGHWEVDDMGLAWDLTLYDQQQSQRDAKLEGWTSDPNDPRNYEWEDQGAFDYELDRYLAGKGDLAATRGKGAIKEWGMQDIHELEEKQWKEFKGESKDKLKLDWVNEILKEFPTDKAPEVLRLPQWKDEEKKPDLSPFLSYLLRQSPYARLPVAGLLGLGLMGYSKPAY